MAIAATVMSIKAISVLFFVVLFSNDKYKFKYAVIFTEVACFSLLILFADLFIAYVIGLSVMLLMAVLTIKSRKKYVLWLAWFLTVIFAVGGVFFTLFLVTYFPVYTLVAYYYRPAIAAVIYNIPIALCVAIMLVATLLRIKRKRVGLSEQNNNLLEKSTASDGYCAERVSKRGFAIAGNILSAVSYVATLIGIMLILLVGGEDDSIMTISIVLFIAALVCGGISWLLFRHAIAYGYSGNPCEFALYIWSWIPTVIIIAILVIVTLIMCLVTNTEFSEKANKKIYKVIDENGEVRTLSYSGTQIYEKCRDDMGEWWETFDGGSTFRKCGEFKIKHDDGTETRLRDVSGANSLLEDDLGELYESDDGGKTVHKIE